MSKIVKLDFKEYQKNMRKGISKEVIKNIEDFSIKFMKDNFDIDFNIPIIIDGRMERKLGTFFYRYDPFNEIRKPVKIKLNKSFVLNALIMDSFYIVEDVLKHELCHYSLFVKGLPHQDGDEIFEKMLLKTNAPSSGVTPENKRFGNHISKYIKQMTHYKNENNESFYFSNKAQYIKNAIWNNKEIGNLTAKEIVLEF